MENEKVSMLTWQDYLVIGIVLLISAGIGVYYRFTGGRQKTAEEYFSANKSMSIVPLGIALMVSFVSAITILGISAEIYAFGTQFVIHYAGIILATIVVAYFYLPVFFELNTMSVYEYLERRFGVAARLTTSIANFMQLTLYTGVVLYAPSLAIEATTGLSSKTSILVIAVICMFYSTIGGIKAVLVTDIFQAILMFASLICIMVVASSEIEGGLGNVWNIAKQGGRIEYFDYRPDPTIRHTGWCLLAAGFCLFCSLYGVNQVEVQRLLTVKSLKSARLALFVNLPLLITFGLTTSFCGLVLYAVYKDCDPVRTGEIASHDRIMPHFAATKMAIYPGLTGLFISGIFSASLSTISAMLNSLAAVFLEDYLKRIYARLGKTFPTQHATFFGKLLAVVNGCISVAIAFLAGSLGSLVQLTLSITGSICGPVLGIFTLGMFFESANEKGAICGIVTALITCMWASFGQPRPRHHPLPFHADGCNASIVLPPTTSALLISSMADKPEAEPASYFYLYRISYMWYSPMGLTITIVVGYISSLIFRKFSSSTPIEPDPSLFTPLVARRIRRRRADAARTTSSQVFTLEEPNGRRP
ncbi:putative sodium-dependent multivitamin transporter [Nasonia vitripennis]|uniref:Sodium-dependent multivitamin transporter n=1 Tax=Nasonia vitripennis TaxID=7425 RepID=A0A7M7IYY9_NASVI|nr:putative sodium-dependent multivitamin transporter [Nasonia vitripennis]